MDLTHTGWIAAGLSDVGDGRHSNEDALLADVQRGLFAVADGIGGHNAGAVAARATVDALPLLLDRRLTVICRDYDGCGAIAASNLHDNLMDTPQKCRLMIVKTIANSWSTSVRYHEVVHHSCLFGCGRLGPLPPQAAPDDSVAHYVHCPILWRLV